VNSGWVSGRGWSCGNATPPGGRRTRRFSRPLSRGRFHVAEHGVESGHEGGVECGGEEDRQIVVARLHQEAAEDRRDAVREPPDNRVHGARQAPLLRRDNAHEERIRDRRGHVHEGGTDQVEARCDDWVRQEREAQEERGRRPGRHDDCADRPVSPRKGGTDDGGEADCDVGERRSEEHTSELQSPCNLVCRLLLEKKNEKIEQSVLSKQKPLQLPPNVVSVSCSKKVTDIFTSKLKDYEETRTSFSFVSLSCSTNSP